jgi:glutamine kinase
MTGNYFLKLMNDNISTKSNMLKFLQKKLQYSKIENIIDFTILEWKNNENKILDNIKLNFNSKVIIRSSAIGEDSFETSQAGNYESILNIDSQSKKKLKQAINSVIQSYYEKNNRNSNNQVLIQNQSLDIITSGVVFTRTVDIGAPYYVINFEDGSSTVGVTQGSINKTIKIFKNFSSLKLEKKWKLLLKSIKEIELLLDLDYLDIEFGITKSLNIIIFQVRPITSIPKVKNIKIDNKIKSVIKSSTKKYKNFKKLNKSTNLIPIFSDMSDWNPSEIIGNNPNLLDYSLYDYLIMQNAWHKGRLKLGYQNMKNSKLMFKFGNKPFVDIEASFNSLIPQNLNTTLKRKLMKYYLEQLIQQPQLHDKVEFEILFTCYDANTDSRLIDLLNYNFSENDIKKIKKSLLDLTNNIINNFPNILDECKKSVILMKKNRENILSNSNLKKQNYLQNLAIAEQLLSDCKNFGTIPFSTLARIAFIATAIFKSFLNKQIISIEFFEQFMNSINTPLSEFQSDLSSYNEKNLSKKDFLKKYGHLRPGTYDITEVRYDKKNIFSGNFYFNKSKSLKIKNSEIKKLNKLLEKSNLDFSNTDFLFFIKESLVERENLKFEFTHNLSDALELISNAGTDLGFSKNELSHLDINTILSSYKKFKKSELKIFWNKKISLQKKKYLINNFLVLPPLIFSENDFNLINYFISKPNFVTSKSITSQIIFLDNVNHDIDISNKIIMLKNADPGYDWIFTKNPSGLITQYGGVASHMAIRCAELALPAAIGCGEIFYEKLKFASKIMLDCKNEKIIILENSTNDEINEVKKTLKLLGYIK